MGTEYRQTRRQTESCRRTGRQTESWIQRAVGGQGDRQRTVDGFRAVDRSETYMQTRESVATANCKQAEGDRQTQN